MFRCRIATGENAFIFYFTQKQVREISSGTKFNGLHRCPNCDKSFAATGGLKRHMEIHTGHFSYYCEICRRGFNNKTNFDIHRRAHEGLKFNCVHCTKSFVKKQTYDYHQSVHTGQYRFNCDKCGKGFNEKALYEKHKKNTC